MPTSPNHGPRPPGARISLIVLHYTGMVSAEGALSRLCDPASGVSCHYLITEGGDVAALVAEDRRAWHAGASYWRGERDINSVSIGIELVNPGHEHGYRGFARRQIGRLIQVLGEIMARYGIGPQGVVGHSDVAPLRKEDPGELFPWAELAAEGVALHPPPGLALDEDATACLMLAAQVGFDPACPPQAILRAAQRRLTPHQVTGRISAQLAAALGWWAQRL